MLGIRHELVFPRIRWAGEGPLAKGNVDKHTQIYRLDWEAFDETLLKQHKRWNRRCWPGLEIPFHSVLPERYDQLLRNARFALNQTYELEIQRNCRRALEEWNIYRGFDTNVRETCLETGQAHAWVAFYLLNDCLYDEETKYYDRGPQSWLLNHAMVYKFWGHQTGGGLLWRNARFEQLLDRVSGDHVSSDVRDAVVVFLHSVREHEKFRDQAAEVWLNRGDREEEAVDEEEEATEMAAAMEKMAAAMEKMEASE